MNFQQKTSTVLFLSLLVILIIHVCFIDIRHNFSQENSPHTQSTEIKIINKVSYGFTLPIIKKSYFWQKPTKGDLIVFRKKSNLISISYIISTEGEVVVFQEKREILPPGFLYVMEEGLNDTSQQDFGFVQLKNILGKVIFVLK